MNRTGIAVMLAAALAAGTVLTGCEVAAPGSLVTEEKDFTDFTHVVVEGTFEVEITQSDSFSTTISADESSFDYIATSQAGGTLRVYLNPRHTFTDFTLQTKVLKAKITMPALRGFQLTGAGKGTVTGFKSSEDFTLTVSGASSVDIADIEVGHAEFKISGASKVTGSIMAEDTVFEVSGASRVTLAGSADSIVLVASGASEVDLTDFPLTDANLTLSGASETTIYTKGTLDAVLSDASRLYFLGNPIMGNVEISGASTIKHK